MQVYTPGKDTGVGCHSFLQGIFPTQGSDPGLLHGRRILYHLSHQGSPLNCLPSGHLKLLTIDHNKKSINFLRDGPTVGHCCWLLVSDTIDNTDVNIFAGSGFPIVNDLVSSEKFRVGFSRHRASVISLKRLRQFTAGQELETCGEDPFCCIFAGPRYYLRFTCSQPLFENLPPRHPRE